MWQLQEAKQKFSEVVRRALDEGPQRVSRHGKPAIVIVSAETYEKSLRRGQDDFKTALEKAPSIELLDIERDARPARRVSL